MVLCPGQSVAYQLTDNPNTTYHWQDGSAALDYTVSKPGTYWVNATTNGITRSDTVQVRYRPGIKLPRDTVLCQGETLTLIPDYPVKNPQFVWSRKVEGKPLQILITEFGTSLKVSEAGQYRVDVAGVGLCAISDSINVQVVDCPAPILIPNFIPNVITPNGDGKNDRFVIEKIDLSPWQLEVYNRWGQQVYKAEPYANDWSGDNLPSGLYYYSLRSRTLRRNLKGWLTIFREEGR